MFQFLEKVKKVSAGSGVFKLQIFQLPSQEKSSLNMMMRSLFQTYLWPLSAWLEEKGDI